MNDTIPDYLHIFYNRAQNNMQEFLNDFENFRESWWPYLISLLICVISAIRLYVGGTYCNTPARVDGKNVIITGGSSGIGLETAKELAKRGANLILAVRNGQKGAKALEEIRLLKRDARVQIKLIDVSEFTSIRNFVDQIKQEYEKIDILINNAGTVGDDSSIKSINGYNGTFLTNYLGPFLLTHLLLPLLNNAENGRVINISAIAHYNGKIKLHNLGKNESLQEAFAESKLALTIFTKYMAQLHKGTNITFNSANPGIVRDTGHLPKFSPLNNSLLTRLSIWPWVWLFLKTPKQGCQTLVYLAVEPSLHKVSGCYFSDCEIKDPAEIVNDINVARALYEKSCKIVGLGSDTVKTQNTCESVPKNTTSDKE